MMIGETAELEYRVIDTFKGEAGPKIHYGRSFPSFEYYWKVSPLNWDKSHLTRRRLRSLQQALLFDNPLIKPSAKRGQKYPSSESATNLRSNIVTIFYIYGACAFFAFLIFGFQLLLKVLRIYSQFYNFLILTSNNIQLSLT